MYKLTSFLLILSLLSCQKICTVTSFFCEQKTPKEEIIDFTQVDQFPKFKNCEDLLDFNENKTCFETTLHQTVNTQVQKLKLQTNEHLVDTVFVRFTINQKGKFSYNQLQSSDSLTLKLPNLAIEVKHIIQNLAPITPAQKRGIPVTSSFVLPLIIKTD